MANRMKWAIPIFFCVLAYATSAQQGKSLEEQLIKSASDSRDAVLSMMFWGPNGQIDPNHVGVVGSAFLINTDGYFVTAAHMLELYSPNTSQLTVIVKQRDENGAGVWFDVVEKDEKHDLALCKIKSPTIKKLDGKNPKASDHPISTLQVSSEIIQQGQLVAVIGFPLRSWNAAVQMGSIAATETINPTLPGVPAGGRELLQVSVSANKGNSGGPVISLRTGKVVGVIIQLVPAPLLAQQPLPVEQNSGIMEAVPASWVLDLLQRNHVVSEAHTPKENLGF